MKWKNNELFNPACNFLVKRLTSETELIILYLRLGGFTFGAQMNDETKSSVLLPLFDVRSASNIAQSQIGRGDFEAALKALERISDKIEEVKNLLIEEIAAQSMGGK